MNREDTPPPAASSDVFEGNASIGLSGTLGGISVSASASSYIKFTALSGARDTGPPCYLLEIDQAKILLDCGWDDAFDPETIPHLKSIAHQLDAVLLSHPDVTHLGALPYARSKLSLTCPVYATLPVSQLGRLAVSDALSSRTALEPFDLFDTKDVDKAFSGVVLLHYRQNTALGGRNAEGLYITPYPAGHSLGGTVWHIQKDEDRIVYAVDFNHTRENLLPPCAFITPGPSLDALSEPSVLIVGSRNALDGVGDSASAPLSDPQVAFGMAAVGRRVREGAIVETILGTLRSSGSVLIPISHPSRLLELGYLLHTEWERRRHPWPVAALGWTWSEVHAQARSMLEWMGSEVDARFQRDRENPLSISRIKFLKTTLELSKLPAGTPRVILCPSATLDRGPSRDLFLTMCIDPRACVIITERQKEDTAAGRLWKEWAKRVAGEGTRELPGGVSVETEMAVKLHHKIPLTGDELIAHHRAEILRKEAQLAELQLANPLAAPSGDADADSEDDALVADVEEARNPLLVHFDAYLGPAAGRGQAAQFRMFPSAEGRRRWDEYGEVIDPEQYMGKEMHFGNAEAIRGRVAERGKEDSMDVDVPSVPDVESGAPEVPSKYLTEDRVLQVRCTVRYVDLEGLADGRSMRNILPGVRAKKIILVHGLQAATDYMQSFCLSNPSLTNEVVAPRVGETVNVSTARNMYQIKLTDQLVSSLRMARLGDYQLAFVDGVIRFPPEGGDPILDLPPADGLGSSLTAFQQPSIIVGDMKLSKFRDVLAAEGIRSEFAEGGVLVCNGGTVAIRKSASGQITIEGVLGEDYYKVRQLVYAQHSIL
ncbi:hypothetical protein M427DRAFT_66501 [Gonapodya prolifera JEL478]|uniref:Cleavage and polyadenylation specificity factor subunit 2 n=1 Tax=Gonapodya prolifera (strain JEL478) TaxID=1344416 RepID=A0A139AUW8_GONPJ|nr:hypothetical protein M427DRAFT_66501 [Gonapodya prolifera JEL478]|eukprot:KXS20522.1 hypothetical protein M427DRAFT_66501 [Gonapodya prolifera JEL478]